MQDSCTDQDTWETLSPAVAFLSGLLAAECAHCIHAFSDGAAGTPGTFGGVLLSSFGESFCQWKCCLPANPPLQEQATHHYILQSIQIDV